MPMDQVMNPTLMRLAELEERIKKLTVRVEALEANDGRTVVRGRVGQRDTACGDRGVVTGDGEQGR